MLTDGQTDGKSALEDFPSYSPYRAMPEAGATKNTLR